MAMKREIIIRPDMTRVSILLRRDSSLRTAVPLIRLLIRDGVGGEEEEMLLSAAAASAGLLLLEERKLDMLVESSDMTVEIPAPPALSSAES